MLAKTYVDGDIEHNCYCDVSNPRRTGFINSYSAQSTLNTLNSRCS